MHLAVGKGLRSLALGSLGTRLSGSIFKRRFIIRGHKYRSRHRSKVSRTECSYAPTDRKLGNFFGINSPCGRSFGSRSFHCSISSSVGRYSSGGMYDSACPGGGSLGAAICCGPFFLSSSSSSSPVHSMYGLSLFLLFL